MKAKEKVRPGQLRQWKVGGSMFMVVDRYVEDGGALAWRVMWTSGKIKRYYNWRVEWCDLISDCPGDP